MDDFVHFHSSEQYAIGSDEFAKCDLLLVFYSDLRFRWNHCWVKVIKVSRTIILKKKMEKNIVGYLLEVCTGWDFSTISTCTHRLHTCPYPSPHWFWSIPVHPRKWFDPSTFPTYPADFLSLNQRLTKSP